MIHAGWLPAFNAAQHTLTIRNRSDGALSPSSADPAAVEGIAAAAARRFRRLRL